MNQRRSFTREEVRLYDRKAIERGVSGRELMEKAAKGAVQVLVNAGVTGAVIIVCGKGNNAGDGFVMARLLHETEIPVAVELVCDEAELTGDAKAAFESIRDLPIRKRPFNKDTANRLRASEWAVDALLGTGAQGEVRPPFDEAIRTINENASRVLAVDLPSGLDCDLGTPLGRVGPTVVAERTATFVGRKRGFDNPVSVRYTGEVHVVDIGAGDPLEVLKAND